MKAWSRQGAVEEVMGLSIDRHLNPLAAVLESMDRDDWAEQLVMVGNCTGNFVDERITKRLHKLKRCSAGHMTPA